MENMLTEFMGIMAEKQLYILFMAVWAIGFVLKSVPRFPNWAIPIVSLVIGGVWVCFVLGFNAQSLAIGIVLGAGASGIYDFANGISKGINLNMFKGVDGQ